MSMLGLGVVAAGCAPGQSDEKSESKESKLPVFDREKAPIVLSTWDHGMAANAGAWPILESGGAALDAVERKPATGVGEP